MSRMSLDTAIRLSAEVKGGGNIDRVKRSLQDLGKNSQVTAREMGALRSATFQFARANDSTLAGIRSSITAFRGLQEQAKIGSREFNRYTAEIQRLEAKLRGLDGTAKQAGESLGKQLATGLAAAGIGQALRGITMQAGRFDAEVRKAAAIEGGAESFGVLRKEIDAVAAVAAGTPTQVAELATALSRAGFSAQETTQSLRGIVLGAEATGVSFAEMGSIAADNLRAFGLATTETGRVVDILTQTANKSNQTVLDVGESMKYAAPVARTLGVSMQDLAGMIALMANAGIRGSDAGTGLRMGLFRLQTAAGGADAEIQQLTRGNVALQKAMNMLGAQILDTEGKLRPLDQVLIALKNSFGQMSTTEQAILSRALFGTEAASKFLATMNFTEAEIAKMFGQIRESGGVAAETQQKMQGFDFAIKVLGGNVEYLTNQIGGMLGMALKPLIDGLNATLYAAQGLPEPIKAIGAAAAAAGVATLGLVAAVAALKAGLAVIGGISAVTGALTAYRAAAIGATGAQIGLNLAVLANPWVALAAGITAATIALARWQSQSQKTGAAARTGDPAAMARARARLDNVGQDISLLERQRAGTTGRERASIDRRVTALRAEQRQLRGDVQVGAAATAPAAAQLPAVAVGAAAVAPAGGGGGGGGKAASNKAANDAKRAAEAAAKEQGRIQDVIRNRRAEIDLLGLRVTMEDRISEAQAQNDKLLERRLQGEQRQVDIQVEYARLLADPANQDARIQEVITQQGLLELQAEQLRTERDLQTLERERGQENLSRLQQYIEKQYELNTAVQQQKAAAESISGTIGQAMSSAFSALVSGAESWHDSLRRIASEALVDIANQLIRIYVIEQAINAIKTFLTPFSPSTPLGAGGGTVGRFGTLGPNYGIRQFAQGGVFTDGIEPFARGGIVNSPTLFKFANGGTMRNGLMGEAGPEAIMPLRRGPDGRLGVAATGGGGDINVSVNVDASGSQVQGDEPNAAQLGRVIAGAVQSEIVKQQRPGGLLSGTRR